MSARARGEGSRFGRPARLVLIDDEGVPTLAVGDGDLGDPVRLRLHEGGASSWPAAERSMGWVLVVAAALFLTAFLGAAQIVAGQQASTPDDEVLANLAG
jgi:hypothetical protein